MPSRAGGLAVTRRADADLSGSQYRIVTFTANGGMALCGNAGDGSGVLQDKPISGKLGAVQVDGATRVVAGAAFSAGVRLASDANGRARLAVATEPVIGEAVEAALAAGDIVEMLIREYKI